MISPILIEHIFKAASISRWNDYPKMIDLNELDKQAHKFIIAYFLAKLENNVNMKTIVEFGIFEFLSRVVVTDIRPNVFHYIQKNKGEELNSWIKAQLEGIISQENEIFKNNFEEYFNHQNSNPKERLILKAASYLATRWEFRIVYQTSQFLSDIEELKTGVEEEIEDYNELNSIQILQSAKKLEKLIDLGGRLRFQKRWAQTQRIPQTNVLGHMLVVAIFSYFYSLEVGACDKRLENNFFCALFHDLPETLTRDIISPVKYGVTGLNDIISEYEMNLIDEKILPLVPARIKDEFSYILGIRKNENGKLIKDEFENRIFDTDVKAISASLSAYNNEKFSPIDGVALKACDRLGAFVEAGISISYGVRTNELEQGVNGIFEKFKALPNYEGVNFLKICENFKEYFKI